MGELALDIFGEVKADKICHIKDPELPYTLQQLDVIAEDDVVVTLTGSSQSADIFWKPTTKTCSFAVNIGLCIIYKLKTDFDTLKVRVFVKEGSHVSKAESKNYAVDRQVNDKERVAAALENPDILAMITEALADTV